MNSLFIIDTSKPFDQACMDLKASVESHAFGLLAIHDLAGTLRGKGIESSDECRVFEVCNPQQAATMMEADLTVSTALPCRISVYTESGKTRIGMIRPAVILQHLFDSPELLKVAPHVESRLMAANAEAAASTYPDDVRCFDEP
jgi:uncharacterized protein (DUF302 family)